MTALLTSGWSCRKPTKSVSALLGSPGMLGRTDAAVAAAASCSGSKINHIICRPWQTTQASQDLSQCFTRQLKLLLNSAGIQL